MDATKYDVEELRQFTLSVADTEGIGSRTYRHLIEQFACIENLYAAFLQKKLNPDLQLLLETSHAKHPRKLPQRMQFTCIWEESYPKNLALVADPPSVLFYVGDISLLNSTDLISIVGTRQMTAYGKFMTQQLCRDLVRNDFAIVSGMAFGVDAAAHIATMDAGGKTVAVLPGAVDVPVPSYNSFIYDRILSLGGVIVSEVFPGTELTAPMFAVRNRIVAGLSVATVVIEAPLKSGALITAEVAAGYGREVMSVPGRSIDNVSSGANSLIKMQKSSLVESADDILIALGKKHPEFLAKYKSVLPKLSAEERIVYDLVKSGNNSLEQICGSVDRKPDDVISLLMVLQMNGALGQDEYGDYFCMRVSK